MRATWTSSRVTCAASSGGYWAERTPRSTGCPVPPASLDCRIRRQGPERRHSSAHLNPRTARRHHMSKRGNKRRARKKKGANHGKRPNT
ncbi:hypothetical protein GUY60_23775 [Streptomyces sp. YC537]|uniref:Uncharacterized protein n=2 Tax=Streptomyces TaxID=1883 RepID=A0A964UU07_9ACTN|nr:hypothetical protein [Streptomyces boluensis]